MDALLNMQIANMALTLVNISLIAINLYLTIKTRKAIQSIAKLRQQPPQVHITGFAVVGDEPVDTRPKFDA